MTCGFAHLCLFISNLFVNANGTWIVVIGQYYWHCLLDKRNIEKKCADFALISIKNQSCTLHIYIIYASASRSQIRETRMQTLNREWKKYSILYFRESIFKECLQNENENCYKISTLENENSEMRIKNFGNSLLLWIKIRG